MSSPQKFHVHEAVRRMVFRGHFCLVSEIQNTRRPATLVRFPAFAHAVTLKDAQKLRVQKHFIYNYKYSVGILSQSLLTKVV